MARRVTGVDQIWVAPRRMKIKVTPTAEAAKMKVSLEEQLPVLRNTSLGWRFRCRLTLSA